MTSRREFLSLGIALALAPQMARAQAPLVSVAKPQNCSCCGEWVKHMEQNGFAVQSVETPQDALNDLKSKLGITQETSSCHTAQIGNYVIEGHVPATDIKRLLKERPDAIGLSVPGMPLGSPGMGASQDGEGFDVLLIKKDGSTELWSRHEAEVNI